MTEPQVFLVDDNVGIRCLLISALSRRGVRTQAFESGQDFLDYYTDEPGCLVLDLSMPGMDGLELQQELAKSNVDIPILFITGHGDIAQSVKAMKAGAMDFFEKPFNLNALLQRIDEAIVADTQRRNQRESRAVVQARFESLTEREQEVMRLLIAGAATGSSKTIAAELGISHRTVDHHRARIMQKTRARSVTELAQLAVWAEQFKAEPESEPQ